MSTSLWTLSWYSKHRLCAITSQISDQCEKKAENPLSLLFVFVFFLSCWLFNLPWLGTSTMIPQNMIYVVPLHKNEFLFRRIENCSRFQLITVLSVWELFAEPSIGYLPPEMKEALSIHWANLSGWSNVCDRIHHEIKYLISLEFHLLASAGTQFIPFVQQILQG